MATSAFKSTTKRTPVTPSSADDSASSTKSHHHRRSRSLSQFSRRLPELDEAPTPTPAPASRGKFVNTVRGSGVPEISLDDLAIEFFPLKDSLEDDGSSSRSRPSRHGSDIDRSTLSSQRRGRSVSRQNSSIGIENGGGARAVADANSRRRRSVSVSRHHIGDSNRKGPFCNGDIVGAGSSRAPSDSNSRRRRSVSVARHRISDSESDIDHSWRNRSNRSLSKGNGQFASLQKSAALSHRRLERSTSHTDLFRSHDDYSSQSSAVTDDETKDAHYVEKTIRAVYAQNKTDHPTEDDVNSGLYEKMRKEFRSVVNEIRTELEQAIVRKPSSLASNDRLQSNNFDVFQAASAVRKNHSTKVKQVDQCKQDLLAAMAMEEQRDTEQSKVVRKSLPDSKSSAVARKTSQHRKRSNDRNKVTKRLDEEAEKYFEDFISNVEDTDFSSFDGERSDTSSTLGGITKSRNGVLHGAGTRDYHSPAGCNSLPVEMEGVNLPWLKWETNNDSSALSSKNNSQLPVVSKTLLWDAPQGVPLMQDQSSHSTGSGGKWSPDFFDVDSTKTGENGSSKAGNTGNSQGSRFNMDEYLNLKTDEELLFESWRERHRISAGGLLLCNIVL